MRILGGEQYEGRAGVVGARVLSGVTSPKYFFPQRDVLGRVKRAKKYVHKIIKKIAFLYSERAFVIDSNSNYSVNDSMVSN